jgi:DNA-binding MarR family transcriptional regulator
MKFKIANLLEALAPLTAKKVDLGEIIILSFLNREWLQNNKVRVNDVLDNIKQYSTASINRKLKKLKKSEVLLFSPDPYDERIKIISQGKNYASYLDQISQEIQKN